MQTFTGLDYLRMDIAASFGLDKVTWAERLTWFHAHEHELDSLIREAEEPAQFLAGTLAYRKVLAGEPTGYLCGMDATASGLQLLALLSGCEKSAALCNLIDTGRREDAYTGVYGHMNGLLGIEGTVLRKAVKAALMTHLYGSKAEPKKAFGEDTPELRAFYQAIDDLLPGADMLNRDLIALWNPEALAHAWTLPDGFDVVVKVMASVDRSVQFLGQRYTFTQHVNQAQPMGLSMGANIVHSLDGMIVREMGRRCNYEAEWINLIQELFHSGIIGGQSTRRANDIQLLRILELHRTTGFLSAVIFEYIDELNYGLLTPDVRRQVQALIDSLPAISFPVLCIHDCFKFHPNYGNDVRRQYRQILSELAASDVLSAIATELTGRPIKVTKLSTTLPAYIAESEYAIC